MTSSQAKKLEDPWVGIAVPTRSDEIGARRASGSGIWNAFWALNHREQCLLLLTYDGTLNLKGDLPKLRQISVEITQIGADLKPALVWMLLDGGARDVFAQLCRDIVGSIAGAATESDALAIAIRRTWRWHHLLRGGVLGKLSEEEQKGLIAELLLLERYFLPRLPPKRALSCWKGPSHAPQDFVLAGVAVESKAHSSKTADRALISSEHQLDSDGLKRLFLHVALLDRAEPGDDQAFTIADVVERVGAKILAGDAEAEDAFEALLCAAGFDRRDDYADCRWRGSERGIYSVSGAFPRLTPATVGESISGVRYGISLANCDSCLVPSESLEQALTEASHEG